MRSLRVSSACRAATLMARQAVVCAAALLIAAPAIAIADSARFAIPAQPLGTALKAFAEQSHMQLLYQYGVVSHYNATPVVGEWDKHAALERLLQGTGLEVVYRDESAATIRLTRSSTSTASSDIASSGAESQAQDGSPTDAGAAQEGKKTSGSFRLAQVGQGQTTSDVPVGSQGENSRQGLTSLTEIVVTAQKRSENLRDVPMSITALSGEQLADTHAYRFEDYVGKVPGLSLIATAYGDSLVIRGLSTGLLAVNNSVATYVDETPYTFPGPIAAVVGSPNFDTYDMQRIEVLKGPQGTLYGANALGGILKYVTNAPDPDSFHVSAEAGASSVSNGSTGFEVHGMVNLPLSNVAALRVVAYQNYTPGFIDDPSRNREDINGSHFAGARASLLIKPLDSFSIRFNALYQDRTLGDLPYEDVNSGTLSPVHGDLVHETTIQQSLENKNQVYNLTLDGDVGFAKIASITSYASIRTPSLVDWTNKFGIFVAPLGVAAQDVWASHAWTQEVRLSSTRDDPFQWQAGGYYTHAYTDVIFHFIPIDAPTHQLLYSSPVNLLLAHIPTTYREYAGFANLDYHITQTVDVAVGGRYSANKQAFSEVGSGALLGNLDFENPSSENVWTYSGDLRWHVASETMLYARIASGYVPGGPNDVLLGNPEISRFYNSSKTINYEVGLKSSMLNNRLSVEASVFDINWHDIQLTAVIGGLSTIVNGGTARSRGVEWNVAYIPVSGLTLNLNGAYTDAQLTGATPDSVGGKVGDKLPNIPLWAGSISADYRWQLFGDYSGVVGTSWRFTGDRDGEFEPVGGVRQHLPSVGIFDLQAGVEKTAWSFSLYVKNVANKIAINYLTDDTVVINPPGSGAQRAFLYQPRTIGVALTAKF